MCDYIFFSLDDFSKLKKLPIIPKKLHPGPGIGSGAEKKYDLFKMPEPKNLPKSADEEDEEKKTKEREEAMIKYTKIKFDK
jgi:hypothetical protein